MALLVDFRKVAEGPTTVEYRFGIEPKLDRRLVIDLATGEGRPIGGEMDSTFHAVLWKIRRGRQELGHWPATGSYAA